MRTTNNLVPCLCGNTVTIEVYEPCDDYPGNGVTSWDSSCECSRCGSHPPRMEKRFKTAEEAIDARVQQWNSFIDSLKPHAELTLPLADADFEEEFDVWWKEDGQYVRSGGGNYERTFAFEAWRHLMPQIAALSAGAVRQEHIQGVKEALWKSFQLGQMYWQQADSESSRLQDKASHTRDLYDALVLKTIEQLSGD